MSGNMIKEKFRNYTANEFYNEVLFESEHFIVIPSLGSLVEGWLLIVPKQHYLSVSEITDYKLLEELTLLTSKVKVKLTSEYGTVVMFEHGAKKIASSVGCGVDYAHLHLVPIKFDLLKGLKKFYNINYSWQEISGINEINKFTEHSEYLFFSDLDNNSFITTNSDIPSQIFRKVIASYLDIPHKYDWKENFEEDKIRATIKRLKNLEGIIEQSNLVLDHEQL
jgi:ATP adenylyltransferase